VTGASRSLTGPVTCFATHGHSRRRAHRIAPIQFLVRRTAQHAMDHAWELEDRDLSS
jgi:hypothetical protein